MALPADRYPTRCPYGHPLGPGTLLAGWKPCVCPPAKEHSGGHRTVQCCACLDAGITTICYMPQHQRTADIIEEEARWLRVALDRAQRTAVTAEHPGARDAAARRAAGLEASLRAKEISIERSTPG